MVGAGESYLPAFALSVGMSETMSGFFSSLPLLGGSFIQLLSPWFVHRLGSAKKWVVTSAFIQGLSFVPLIWFSIHGTNQFFILFLIAILYWGFGFAAGPSWNYWMEHIVPAELAENYFSRRNRITQFGIMVGLIGGGLALHYQIKIGPFTTVFSVLFLVAFLSRASSSFILSLKMADEIFEKKWSRSNWARVIGSVLKNHTYKNLFLFLFFFYISIMVSSPYVAPFFLRKMKLDYLQFMIAIGSLFLAKMMALPFVPKLIRKWGLQRVLLISALGISPLPAFWALSQDFWFALVLQTVSGIFWGIFEVCLSLMFFKNIKTQDKIVILSGYNLFNSVAIICGTLLGGNILHFYQESIEGYFAIFIGGSVLRLLVVFTFQKKLLIDSEN